MYVCVCVGTEDIIKRIRSGSALQTFFSSPWRRARPSGRRLGSIFWRRLPAHLRWQTGHQWRSKGGSMYWLLKLSLPRSNGSQTCTLQQEFQVFSEESDPLKRERPNNTEMGFSNQLVQPIAPYSGTLLGKRHLGVQRSRPRSQFLVSQRSDDQGWPDIQGKAVIRQTKHHQTHGKKPLGGTRLCREKKI